jgi:PIN domain nuclease of toxin-antitoxin system
LRYVFAIRSRQNEVFFSPASIWEIATSARAARWAKGFSAQEIASGALDAGFVELPINSDAAARVGTLPPFHDDAFDRILMAQAIVEPASLLTTDKFLQQYTDIVEVVEPMINPRYRYGASSRTAR